MKTTLEIPDPVFRRAKSAAAENGIPLREFVTEAVKDERRLNKSRAALGVTQGQLADVLRVKQAAISKVERRSDMFISTLRRIIEAMGGELEIRAILPGIVRINQF
jgi:DNA-binding XRE family transcriptional regulator